MKNTAESVCPLPPPSNLAEVAIHLKQLSYRYPLRRRKRCRRIDMTPATRNQDIDRPALNAVDLQVASGEVFAVLGPNGSGKTTLFRILATLLRPTAGRASIHGYDVIADPDSVRQRLGVVFQTPSVDLKLTARENLTHQGHLYGLSGAVLRGRIRELLDQFGLNTRCDEPMERFSGGMRRRVEVAKALLHQPQLLLLDEPSTGLDVSARHDLWILLDALRQHHNVTVALTTHLMEEAQHCGRLAILNKGQLVALDTPANLTAQIGGQVIVIDPSSTDDLHSLRDIIERRFGPWDNRATPRVVDGQIHLEKPQGAMFVANLATALPNRIHGFTVRQPTLEDVFLHLTGHTMWSVEPPPADIGVQDQTE